MNLLEVIENTDKKGKELLAYLADLVKSNPSILEGLDAIIANATDVQKGVCIETLEYVSQENPAIVAPYLPTIISQLSCKAPRVKWEAARVIANLSELYPDEAAKGIDLLLENSKDKGTVVRWSTALALGEIAKYNATEQVELVGKIKKLVLEEQNNGVKNVYQKALKIIAIISGIILIFFGLHFGYNAITSIIG